MYQHYYRRIKKKPIYKKPLLWIVLIILVSLSAVFLIYNKKRTNSTPVQDLKKEIKQNRPVIYQQNAKVEQIKPYVPDCDHVRFANVPIKPSSKLNDINDVQLVHALRNGLKNPFKTNNELIANIENLKRKSILFEVTENNFYQFKSLTHSQPYLIPEAIDMLNEIGYRFQKKWKQKRKIILSTRLLRYYERKKNKPNFTTATEMRQVIQHICMVRQLIFRTKTLLIPNPTRKKAVTMLCRP